MLLNYFIVAIPGPYLREGVTGSPPPPKCSPQNLSTLFQRISAVAVVNPVTILSRSIAFSFHLQRSVTPESAERASAAGSSLRTRLGELTTLPQTPYSAGEGDAPSPISTLRRLQHLDAGASYQ